jgi:general secretion pathway protein A
MQTEMYYYYRHFGLSGPPFEMVGQPTSLYMSGSHREGLAALEWGLLHEAGSFTLLMGEVGTGKTTLINVLLSRHYDLARIAYVMNPMLGFEEMLRVILEQLGYLPNAVTKLELLRKFEWVLGQLRPKERIAIIVDEAQALSDETLEELRLFSNYGRYSEGHLAILLVGQPELLTRLMAPSLRQFHQRIGARALLNPLRREEAFEYIEHKLRETGGTANRIFAKRALLEMVDHSQGIPRQLNLLCNNALISAYAAGLGRVSLKVARAAINEYENVGGTAHEFREPLARQILRSITARPAIPLTGLGLVALTGLYSLGIMGVPVSELMFRNEAKPVVSTDVGQHHEATSNANRIDASSAPGSIPRTSLANPGHNTQPKSHEMFSYSVQSGDTIEGIALRHLGSEVKIQSLIEANPQLRDVNRIYPGETVYLPAESTQSDENGSH